MNKIKLPIICYTVFLILTIPWHSHAAGEPEMPDISGSWVNLTPEGEETSAIFTFKQDGKYLDGTFVDSKDGQIIIEAPLQGYIDVKGNVIFDISFGRITSTNKLKLSPDKTTLDGKFSNNADNQGDVHIRRQ